ncbi:MAG: ComEC/Rec2 family competence protein, partial [Ignavibacteriaceae bacterium]
MKDYPAIKFTLLFILGILSAHFFYINFIIVIILFLVSVVLILIYKRFRDNFYFSFFVFLAAGFLIFSIGNHLAKDNESSFNPFLTGIDKVKNTTAIGKIDRIDLIKNNELIFYLSADSIYSEDFYIRDKILLLCKIKSDNTSLIKYYDELKPGNYLELTGYYYKGREERNPGEFDYDAYLKSKGILGILSINDPSSIKIIDYQEDFLGNSIHQIRKQIDWQ